MFVCVCERGCVRGNESCMDSTGGLWEAGPLAILRQPQTPLQVWEEPVTPA